MFGRGMSSSSLFGVASDGLEVCPPSESSEMFFCASTNCVVVPASLSPSLRTREGDIGRGMLGSRFSLFVTLSESVSDLSSS